MQSYESEEDWCGSEDSADCEEDRCDEESGSSDNEDDSFVDDANTFCGMIHKLVNGLEGCKVEFDIPNNNETGFNVVISLRDNLAKFVEMFSKLVPQINKSIDELTNIKTKIPSHDLYLRAIEESAEYNNDSDDDDVDGQTHGQYNSESIPNFESAVAGIRETLAGCAGIDTNDLKNHFKKTCKTVKWLTVLVNVVFADLKPKKSGNHAHEHFKKFLSPGGKSLTPGLLLELYCRMLFKAHTGKAKLVGQAGDQGIDLWVGNDELPCQCKNMSHKLSPSIVREFLGTLVLCKKKEGYIVYTQHAEKLTPGVKSVVDKAKRRGYKIHIWTVDIIVRMTIKYSHRFKSKDFVSKHRLFDIDKTFNSLSLTKVNAVINGLNDLQTAIKKSKLTDDNDDDFCGL